VLITIRDLNPGDWLVVGSGEASDMNEKIQEGHEDALTAAECAAGDDRDSNQGDPDSNAKPTVAPKDA
jgi:hypothetical protein